MRSYERYSSSRGAAQHGTLAAGEENVKGDELSLTFNRARRGHCETTSTRPHKCLRRGSWEVAMEGGSGACRGGVRHGMAWHGGVGGVLWHDD